ncbi:ABC transporter substrate-binding protein [Anaerocolumna sp.]|uniref:ABC transporter substrate-binding protein n=1 Tax=Anaerocolumna sp. TaxID=2041569 RepID=UPI0028A5D9B5|nr:ABC transporter substrate-binding protein [Anaerocolumna sp.]
MKKVLSVLLTVMMVATLLTGCGKEKKSDETSAEGEKVIKFGLLAPLTGTNAEYGKGFQIATAMAVDEINAAGGVNGYKLAIEVADSKGDQKESSDLARKFGDDKEIMAIIGDFASGACMANAPIVDAAGIVQLSPTASNPDYAGMSPYTFSIMGRQDAEAPFFAKYIIDKYLGVKSVALIYINSDWGVASHDNFVKGAKEAGLNIVAEANYVQDEKDFSSVILKLKAANPEVLIIFDQGAVPQIVNQVVQLDWDVKMTTLGPGTSQQILDLCGENAEGLITSTPFFFDLNNEAHTAWKDTFKEKSGFEPTVHPVVAYDCVYLLAKAVEMIGNGEITRDAIRDNLQKAEIEGLAGPIKFSEAGDISRQYLICAVEDGKFVIKEGYDYSK